MWPVVAQDHRRREKDRSSRSARPRGCPSRQATTGMPPPWAPGARAIPSFQERSTPRRRLEEGAHVLPVARRTVAEADASSAALARPRAGARTVTDLRTEAAPADRRHGLGEDSQQVVMVLTARTSDQATTRRGRSAFEQAERNAARRSRCRSSEPDAAPPRTACRSSRFCVGARREGRQRTLRRPREQPRGQPRALVEVEP